MPTVIFLLETTHEITALADYKLALPYTNLTTMFPNSWVANPAH